MKRDVKRIKEAIENNGIKQNWIAKKINVTPTFLTLVLQGERELSDIHRNEIFKLLKLNSMFFRPRLTNTDLEWLSLKIRNEFDSNVDSFDNSKDLILIDRAERLGLKDLADEMRNDLNISNNRNIKNISR